MPAFDKNLHPRDAHGKFALKPGHRLLRADVTDPLILLRRAKKPPTTLHSPKRADSEHARLVHGHVPEGPHVYYRGSNANEIEIREGAYFTDRVEHATPYVHHGKKGHLFSAFFPHDLRIADEDDILEAASATNTEVDEDRVWALTESRKVRSHLKKAGFEVVDFEDEGPENAYTHQTRMVLDGSRIRVIGNNTVSPAPETDEDD